MSKILIVAEHLNGKLNSSTARCVTCARDLKPEAIDILVLADTPDAIAAAAAKIEGVSKVLTLANAVNAHALAATYAPQIAAAAPLPAAANDAVRTVATTIASAGACTVTIALPA